MIVWRSATLSRLMIKVVPLIDVLVTLPEPLETAALPEASGLEKVATSVCGPFRFSIPAGPPSGKLDVE